MQKFFGFDSTIGVGRNFGFNAIAEELPLTAPTIMNIYEDTDMAGGVRIEFAQFGNFDSFTIYRSTSPIDVNALPQPIVSDLKKMYYIDASAVVGATNYYKIAVKRGATVIISEEVSIFVVDPTTAKPTMRDYFIAGRNVPALDYAIKQKYSFVSTWSLTAPQFGSEIMMTETLNSGQYNSATCKIKAAEAYGPEHPFAANTTYSGTPSDNYCYSDPSLSTPLFRLTASSTTYKNLDIFVEQVYIDAANGNPASIQAVNETEPPAP